MSFKMRKVFWLYIMIPVTAAAFGTVVGLAFEFATAYLPLPVLMAMLWFGIVVHEILAGRLTYGPLPSSNTL